MGKSGGGSSAVNPTGVCLGAAGQLATPAARAATKDAAGDEAVSQDHSGQGRDEVIDAEEQEDAHTL